MIIIILNNIISGKILFKYMERNIILRISFDGTRYYGWQKQKEYLTVQNVIEDTLFQIFQEKINTTGISRTDTGVHALSFILNFKTTNEKIPCEKIKNALNSLLPKDIRLFEVKETNLDFNSRHCAKAREYIYIINNSINSYPIFNNYSYNYRLPLDLSKLKEVCKLFVGKHSFYNFCYGYKKKEKENNKIYYERTIYYLRVTKIKWFNQDFIIFFIKGDSFLRGMIRSIVSTAINYSLGKINKDLIIKALNNEIYLDNKYRPPVPPSGLYLKRGYY